MLKKAAALFVICAGPCLFVRCGTTISNYLYAALPGVSEIVAYREDPNSGFLTLLSVSPITAGPSVQSLAIHPSRKFLYAANAGENDVSLFTISPNGALTEVTPRTRAGTVPTLLVMDPGGKYLYVANSASNNISVFSIDTTNGALTEVSGSPFQVGVSPLNMTLAPSGKFLYITGSALPGALLVLSINQASSPCKEFLCLIQLSQLGTNPYGLAIATPGSKGQSYIYVANSSPDNSISEFSINSSTGTVTQLAGSPIGEAFSSPTSILVTNSANYMYIANEASGNLAAYSIDGSGGITLLQNSPFATNPQPISIATDTLGKYLFVGNQGSSAAIESFLFEGNSGTLTEVHSNSVGSTATSIVITP
jgi:6-phosphogluconolactonase